MAFASNVFVQKCLVCTADLSHVTNLLYKQGIFVQIRWTHCNTTNNFQCCQYHTLIRILPEEPNSFSPKGQPSIVDGSAFRASSPVSRGIPNNASHFQTILFSAPGVGEPVRLPPCARFLPLPADFSPAPENAGRQAVPAACAGDLIGQHGGPAESGPDLP